MFRVRQKLDMRIEVEDTSLLIVLPERMDNWAIPWQEAMVVGQILEQASEDIPQKPTVIDPVQAEIEQLKLKLNKYQGKYVVLLFDWTDRIRLSYEAARTLGRAIKLYAQDLDYAQRGIHMDYNAPGRKGRPTPWHDQIRFPTLFGQLGKSE